MLIVVQNHFIDPPIDHFFTFITLTHSVHLILQLTMNRDTFHTCGSVSAFEKQPKSSKQYLTVERDMFYFKGGRVSWSCNRAYFTMWSKESYWKCEDENVFFGKFMKSQSTFLTFDIDILKMASIEDVTIQKQYCMSDTNYLPGI